MENSSNKISKQSEPETNEKQLQNLAVLVLLCEQTGVSWFKGLGVTGSVKFAYHPDPP